MRRIVFSLLVMSVAVGWGSEAAVPALGGEKLIITMKVTSGGLLTTDVPVVEKKITLPRGTRVRLVLDYADTNRNPHRFTLVSAANELESGTIDADGHKSTTLEFTVGENGVSFHRLSCELLCVAMDHLTDYIFLVSKS